MVALGYGKFVRADRVFALVPLDARGAATRGRRGAEAKVARTGAGPSQPSQLTRGVR